MDHCSPGCYAESCRTTAVLGSSDCRRPTKILLFVFCSPPSVLFLKYHWRQLRLSSLAFHLTFLPAGTIFLKYSSIWYAKNGRHKEIKYGPALQELPVLLMGKEEANSFQQSRKWVSKNKRKSETAQKQSVLLFERDADWENLTDEGMFELFCVL